MATLEVAHTLHGYDRGHRLLAHAGDIDHAELEPLDRLSDLSGYLPSGEDFAVYHTGFPCGRYYALAATWLDTSAKRTGTVLTHTLLFPLASASLLPDLQALATLHRRPSNATDTAGYREAIKWDPSTMGPLSPPLDAADLRALVTLWFAQPQRPVLWVSPVPKLDVIAHLWQLLGPAERVQLAFCTYALQVRRIAGQAFGFLHLPAAARAGFHELAGSAAWCDNGRLLHPSAIQASQDPFVDRMVRDPATILDGLRSWCRQYNLAMPRAPDVPAAYRVLELEMPAKQRLAAARSRADLIGRIWPQVAWDHRVRKDAVDTLALLLPDAPMAPRPLWELRDFLARPEVQARGATDPEFTRRVASLAVAELSRRLHANPEQSLTDAIELIIDPPVLVREAPLLSTLRSALRSSAPSASSPRVTFAAKTLAAAGRRQHRPLAELVFEDLAPAQRVRVTFEALDEFRANEAAEVRSFLLQVAIGLHDAVMVFAIASVNHTPIEAMRSAERAAAGAAGGQIKALEPLLEQVSSRLWIEWAVRVEDDRVGQWAAAHVPASPALTLEEVAALCDEAAFGARVFAEYASRRPSDEIQGTLVTHPLLAQALVAYALGHASAALIAGHAFEVRPARDYLVPSVLVALAHADYGSAQAILERLGPAWLDYIGDDEFDAEIAGKWLGAGPLRTWIEKRLSPWEESDPMVAQLAELLDLARLLTVACRAVVELGAAGDWCYALLLPSLRQADGARIASAASELMALIVAPWQEQGLPLFASEILGRINRLDRTPNVPSLVSAAFCAMYRGFVTGRDERFCHTSWWRSSPWGWDRAKAWRHWFLDTWIKQRWPPSIFAEAIESIPSLWGELRDRAEFTREGKEFWRMVEALRTAQPRH